MNKHYTYTEEASTLSSTDPIFRQGFPMHFVWMNKVWTRVDSIYAFEELAGFEYVSGSETMAVWND